MNKINKKFSSFCIALSATALLTVGLLGQAQSQVYPRGKLLEGRLPGIAFYDNKGNPQSDEERKATGIGSAAVSARFDLVRLPGERKTLRKLSITIIPKGEDPVKFSNIHVRSDGTYRQTLEGGHRIEGKVANFLDTAFSSNWFEKGISGTYTKSKDVKITYKTNQGHGWKNGYHDPLTLLMYFDSMKYVATDYTEYLGDLKTGGKVLRGRWNSKHIERGESLKEREKANEKFFSASLRLYRDFYRDDTVNGPGFYAEPVENISCAGMICEAAVEDKDTAEIRDRVTVLEPGHFLPSKDDESKDDVHVVVPNRGIYLTLDRSKNNAVAKNSTTGSPLSFGAWMDHAGFFVATRGTYTDGVDRKKRAARMVVAAGERTVVDKSTDHRPTGNAVWHGAMVGTVLEGEAKDHILRGDAKLWFNLRRSELGAEFFNIVDYDRFGKKHQMAEVKTGARNKLRFSRIPVAKDGSYAMTYDNNSGSIGGAFYGDEHAETAGTFERFGVVGAFGAKKVVPEAPAN